MRIWGEFLDLVLPVKSPCLICGTARGQEGGVCNSCRERIMARDGYGFCTICGRPHPWAGKTSGRKTLCLDCVEDPPEFTVARSLGPYREAMQEAVHMYKYRGCRSLADFFGLLLAEKLLDEPELSDADVLVPVPLSPHKLAQRGFNQSELLALRIGRILGMPVADSLARTRDTQSQSKLTRWSRQDNVKGAFALRPGQGFHKKAVLIDDVLTTGATVRECSRVLLAAGFRQVCVLTIASGVQEI